MGKHYEQKISYSGLPVVYEKASISVTYNVKEQRKRIKEWSKQNIVGKSIFLPQTGINVTFTLRGIKEALNQPHQHFFHKNELIKDIEKALISAEFIKSEPDKKGDLNFIYHYYKTSINKEESFIVLKEIRKEGKIIFYSIVDKIKK